MGYEHYARVADVRLSGGPKDYDEALRYIADLRQIIDDKDAKIEKLRLELDRLQDFVCGIEQDMAGEDG